jgi:hypothetical protein
MTIKIFRLRKIQIFTNNLGKYASVETCGKTNHHPEQHLVNQKLANKAQYFLKS